MQLLRRLRKLSVFGGCIALWPVVMSAQVAAPLHTLDVVITDCWGNAVTSAAITVQSVPQRSETVFLKYPEEKKLQLATGEYLTSITANGFFPILSHLPVGETDSEFRACLTLSPVAGTWQPFSKLDVQSARV